MGIARFQSGGGATTSAAAAAGMLVDAARLAGSVRTYCAVEISAMRCRRSLARHRWMRVRIAGGTSGGKALQSGSRPTARVAPADSGRESTRGASAPSA
jgi:hypothetical protein